MLCPFPSASVPADLRRDLKTVHDQMAHQYVAKTYNAMVALTNARFVPDFRYGRLVGPSMTLFSISDMRDDEVRNLKAGRADGPIRWRTRLDGWTRTGDVLTLIAHHGVDGDWLIGDRRHPVHFDNAVRETWVRRDGEWKALRWDEVWFRGTMDGKTHERGREPKLAIGRRTAGPRRTGA